MQRTLNKKILPGWTGGDCSTKVACRLLSYHLNDQLVLAVRYSCRNILSLCAYAHGCWQRGMRKLGSRIGGYAQALSCYIICLAVLCMQNCTKSWWNSRVVLPEQAQNVHSIGVVYCAYMIWAVAKPQQASQDALACLFHNMRYACKHCKKWCIEGRAIRAHLLHALCIEPIS